MKVDRRQFGAMLLGGAAVLLPGCSQEDRRTPTDHENLAAQRRTERAGAGAGRYGSQRYAGYRDLARLPWYELDSEGRLRCIDPEVPHGIDIHAHLGMSLLFAPALDLQTRTTRVEYMLDCDARHPALPFDLDVYANANFDDAELSELRWGAVRQLTVGSGRAETQTLPNLLAEMNDCRIERACLLPISFGLPFGDDLTRNWLDAIEESGNATRFIPGASVHPRDPAALDQLGEFSERGCRIVKLHPGAQRFYPDEPEAMSIYEACNRLGLVVFFHAGRAGIEPEIAQQYNLVRFLEPALAEFPGLQVVLGHAGARDVAEAIPLAQRYPNAWLGIHGQSISQLGELIDAVDNRRLLFGSDWPFYPLATSQAKVLIVSEHNPELRTNLLRENARHLFERAAAA